MNRLRAQRVESINVTPRKISFLEFGHVYVYYMLYAYVIDFRMSFILHEHLINDLHVFMLMHDYIYMYGDYVYNW